MANIVLCAFDVVYTLYEWKTLKQIPVPILMLLATSYPCVCVCIYIYI